MKAEDGNTLVGRKFRSDTDEFSKPTALPPRDPRKGRLNKGVCDFHFLQQDKNKHFQSNSNNMLNISSETSSIYINKI